jgi:ABC-type branched-subunit amino acid transport system ATPase component
MTAPALAAERVTRRFGSLVAVDEVSLSLEVGELHAVIGPNGAGKSTLVNLLAGEVPPSAGRLRVDGRDVTGWPSWRLARSGIGRSFQKTNLLRDLSVFENVRLAAQSALRPGWLGLASRAEATISAAQAAIARVGLEGFEDSAAAILPHGRQRLLEIAMALATAPRVLLLDEPLAGMGAEESERIGSLIRALAADHAVLLIEHDMDVVFRIADRLTVMVEGRVLESGAPEAIRSSAAVRDAYLGHDL